MDTNTQKTRQHLFKTADGKFIFYGDVREELRFYLGAANDMRSVEITYVDSDGQRGWDFVQTEAGTLFGSPESGWFWFAGIQLHPDQAFELASCKRVEELGTELFDIDVSGGRMSITPNTFFKNHITKRAVRAMLRTGCNIAGEEHQALVSDENSPIYNGAIEATTCEAELKIFDQDDLNNPLYEVFGQDGDSKPGDTPIATPPANATEQQRRFYELAALCDLLAENLAEPEGKVVYAEFEMAEFEDDGQGDERPAIIFAVTRTYEANANPVDTKLENADGPVDIAELPT